MNLILIDGQVVEYFQHILPESFVKQVEESGVMSFGVIDEEEKAAVAAAVFCVAGEYFQLEWICVLKEYQGLGIASLLLQFSMQNMQEIEGIKGVFTEFGKERTFFPFYLFLKQMDFEIWEGTEDVYSFPLVQVVPVLLKHKVEKKKDEYCFREMSNFVKNKITQLFAKNKDGNPLGFPIKWEQYDADLSMVSCVGERVVSVLFLKKEEENILFSFAYSEPGCGAFFGRLLALALKKGIGLYGEERKVIIPTLNSVSEELVKKIVPSAEKLKVCQARYGFME